VRVLLKALLVGALAFYIGWLMGWHFEGYKHELSSVRQEVKNIPSVPEPIKPEVKHILKANPEISEAEAVEIFNTIEQVVESFQTDPCYRGGVAEKVNARLVLSLIITESNCRKRARGSSGEIGLTQVMPFHAKSLHRAGILSEPHASQLWNIRNNIKSGVYILMMQAMQSATLKEALARYNAGPRRVKAGTPYALKVMRQYSRIDG
jgi:hypothetical protein